MNWQDPYCLVLSLAAVLLRFPDDAALVDRLRRREADAAAELYDRYGRVAFSVIIRIVRQREVAEELLQECFLRVWNRMQSYDPARGALGAWVLTVARNQAIDYMRSAGARARLSETPISPLQELAAHARFGDELELAQQVRQVRAALETLPKQQREVIELAYFEGLTQTEMAARLNQPLGTVKSWARLALRTLREALNGVAVP
jgi:RNA polymerase sigma-70 factor (ECF subfamily)